MENFILEPTEKTLKINFNVPKGIFEMEGSSYSENTWQFFQSLNVWLRRYIAEVGNPITLNLKINYLNSTSTKYLMDFLLILEEFYENGGKVKVNWYYEEGDDIQEMGEDFAADLNLPLDLIVYD